MGSVMSDIGEAYAIHACWKQAVIEPRKDARNVKEYFRHKCD